MGAGEDFLQRVRLTPAFIEALNDLSAPDRVVVRGPLAVLERCAPARPTADDYARALLAAEAVIGSGDCSRHYPLSLAAKHAEFTFPPRYWLELVSPPVRWLALGALALRFPAERQDIMAGALALFARFPAARVWEVIDELDDPGLVDRVRARAWPAARA